MLNKGRRTGIVSALFCVSVIILTAFFVFAVPEASAQVSQAQQNVGDISSVAGVGETDLITTIGRIINIFLSFLGIIFLGLMLYAGYTWMTAAGDPEKIETAKKTIRNAIIGILIIASSWAITAFVLKALTDATTGGGLGSSGSPFGGLVGSSGSLGSGIIEYHVPSRNATDVARNTPVILTFKKAVLPSSFIEGWTEDLSGTIDGLNSDNIQIYRSGNEDSALSSAQARVTFTDDRKTFVIRPVEYLGSPATNVNYSVKLEGGNSGIVLNDGSPAFSGAFSQGYEWGFEVSTFVDTTPPKVLAAIPYSGGKYPKNVVIQITFDEAVDPVGASGMISEGSGFTNISIRPGAGVGTPLDGEFKISNEYKTIEFLSSDLCGVNSCGKSVFCLPGDATLEVLVKAATLSTQPPLAQLTAEGFDESADIVGNSLDGNANGVGEGAPIDNYVWSFATSNDIKLTPPKILETTPDASPGLGQSNRPLDEVVTATFDTLMQSSSFTSNAAEIQPSGPGETDPDTFWYSVSMQLLNSANIPIKQGEVATKAQLVIKHRPYLPSGQLKDEIHYYDPFLFSDLKDSYQNCFKPGSSNICTGAPNCCNNSPKSQECKFTP